MLTYHSGPKTPKQTTLVNPSSSLLFAAECQLPRMTSSCCDLKSAYPSSPASSDGGGTPVASDTRSGTAARDSRAGLQRDNCEKPKQLPEKPRLRVENVDRAAASRADCRLTLPPESSVWVLRARLTVENPKIIGSDTIWRAAASYECVAPEIDSQSRVIM